MINVKWLPTLCFLSILLLSGLACTLTSRSPGRLNPSNALLPQYTIRQLPAQGDWIIGERDGDRHFFAYNVATGETLALDLSQGGLAPSAEPDDLLSFSTGYLSYAVTWDGRYTFNPPQNSETGYTQETAGETLQIVYRSENQFDIVITDADGQQRVLGQGERPSGKVVEDVIRSADGRFFYIYWHTGYPNPGHPEFMVVDTATGSSRTLYQINEEMQLFRQRYTLSPDGQTLYLGLPDRLVSLSATDGSSRTVFQIRDGKQGLANFSLSPDGDRLVYLQRMEECRPRRDIEGNVLPPACRHELFMINVDGKEQKQLTEGLADTPAVPWIIWWQGPEPGAPPPVPEGVAQAHQLHNLPVVSEGLAGGHLILLQTENGLLSLSPRQTKPVPWQPGTEMSLAEILTGGHHYAHFGSAFYLRDGRWADLSQLSRPANGRFLISPSGRYIAYETDDGIISDKPGPYTYLEDLLTQDGRPILAGGGGALSWFKADSTLLVRAGNEISHFHIDKIPLTEGSIGGFAAWGRGWPLAAYYQTTSGSVSNDGLVWRAGEQLRLSAGSGQPLTETMHPDRPFAIAPNGNTVAWIDQAYPQLRVHSMFNPGSGSRGRPLSNQPLAESLNPVSHLAWSPSSEQVVIWAADSCAGQTPPPADCYGDLYLIDLSEGVAVNEVIRLTDSQIPFGQVTGLQWLGTGRPTETETPLRYAGLSQLPVTGNALAATDLVLLQTAVGPLALDGSSAALSPWKTSPATIDDVLAVDFAHFGTDFYDSSGHHADLSFLPHPVVGRVLVSPNGRFIAYEKEGEDAERPGSAIYLYDRQRGQPERVTHGDSDLLGWSGDSRYLYIRSRGGHLRIEPLGPGGERVVGLDHFAPDLTGVRPVLGTADGQHLIWQTGAQMTDWMFIHRTAVTDIEGNESSNNRAYRLADQLFEPYVFSLSPDERYLAYFAYERPGLYVRLVDGRTQWQLNQNAHIHHLVWSPDGEQLLVWATTDCLLIDGDVPPGCNGDLYLFDLTNLAEEGYATAVRLTDSQLEFDQVTGMGWFRGR